jgi:hypothetical protein
LGCEPVLLGAQSTELASLNQNSQNQPGENERAGDNEK